MAPRKKAGKFSVTKAVKANARERVGQPRPERAIEDPKRIMSVRIRYARDGT